MTHVDFDALHGVAELRWGFIRHVAIKLILVEVPLHPVQRSLLELVTAGQQSRVAGSHHGRNYYLEVPHAGRTCNNTERFELVSEKF